VGRRCWRSCTAGALGWLVLALLAACAPAASRPADCEASSVAREAKLTADGLDPYTITVCRGQTVHLVIRSEVKGVLHLHGYDEQSWQLAAGSAATFDFLADHPGQFVMELHTDDAPQGQGMGVFTVDER
jgi:hypothetical protein